MSAPILVLEGVSVAYGKVEAVRGVSLAHAAGQIVTVIGANGAGKTTLLNALMGVLPSRRHACVSTARALAGDRSRSGSRAGMALVPERRELFGVHDGRGQPACSAAFARTAAERARVAWREVSTRRFPRLQERRAPARRHAVGRRAPDAGHGPRADGDARAC